MEISARSIIGPVNCFRYDLLTARSVLHTLNALPTCLFGGVQKLEKKKGHVAPPAQLSCKHPSKWCSRFNLVGAMINLYVWLENVIFVVGGTAKPFETRLQLVIV